MELVYDKLSEALLLSRKEYKNTSEDVKSDSGNCNQLDKVEFHLMSSHTFL